MNELPVELIVHVLRGNVGVFTYVQAAAVSTAWRAACRSDTALLCAVSSYAGGLARSHFMGLLGLTFVEAVSFPHRAVPRAPCFSVYRTPSVSDVYFLYSPDAVRRALVHLGGLDGWRHRLACIARRGMLPPWWWTSVEHFGVLPARAGLRQWELEEELHWELHWELEEELRQHASTGAWSH